MIHFLEVIILRKLLQLLTPAHLLCLLKGLNMLLLGLEELMKTIGFSDFLFLLYFMRLLLKHLDCWFQAFIFKWICCLRILCECSFKRHLFSLHTFRGGRGLPYRASIAVNDSLDVSIFDLEVLGEWSLQLRVQLCFLRSPNKIIELHLHVEVVVIEILMILQN